ncbi:MAG: flagellar hook-associated protein FlgL [Proteobacteria bacterium]|nr:flagellar hook-associated protein FlgL [Pseudomonadota bacterium]
MRVTTGMIFDSGVAQIQSQNSQLLKSQKEVATGRRVLAPSDDPVASARALEVTQSKSVNALYTSNQGYATDQLKLVDSKLSAATDLVTYVRTRAVESGNGAYTNSEQLSIAADITQQFSALQGIANSQDSTGEYIFGGYTSNTQPFVGSLTSGMTYQGDQGARTLQISSSRNLPITSSGDEIFNVLRAQAGSAFALSAAGNTGTALVSGLGLNAYNGHTYDVSVGAGPTYQVFDSTADPTHAAPIAPTVTVNGSDTTLTFGGVSMTLSGAAAAGDTYSVGTVASAFDVMGNFVAALQSGNSAVTRFGGRQAIAGMDAAQDSISRVQAGVGSRMLEVETQQNIGSSLDLQYSETLSRLQDADYASAVSSLSQQQIYLQAAQQSFIKVSNLSLFNYIN